MQLLKDKILREGKALSENIIKVDSFLNHQIDPFFLQEIGREFARRFCDEKITKILTLEASGIAIALMTGLELGVPVVFAKKKKAATQKEKIYKSTVRSFTKGETNTITVSADYLSQEDRVLIIDDFLAMGEAALGLVEIVRQANAHLVGIGIVIEKSFQPGGKGLREQGIRVESLAIIERVHEGEIMFKE